MKRLSYFLLVLFVSVPLVFAGVDKRELRPLVIDEGVPGQARTGSGSVSTEGSSITWVAVDTNVNIFGQASRSIKPLAYDPRSGALALIYRGHPNYGSGGQLWYSTSVNGGANWTRVGHISSGTPAFARYPSVTLHNPTNSTNPSDLLVPFSAPQLTPSAFGYMVYGVDQFGANTPFAVEVQGDGGFWSNTGIWSAGDWIHWICRNGNSGYNFWRTQDYTTVTGPVVPPSWSNTNFALFGLDLGGSYRNNISYFASFNVFTGEAGQVWNLGYSRSTNGGATWSQWTKVDNGTPSNDWRSIPGIAGTIWDDFFDYDGPGTHSFDWVVDANNRVHFFAVLWDTLTDARAIAEIYETGTGWAAQIIQPSMTTTVNLTYPFGATTLNQTGHHLNASISADGQVMSLVWLDAGAQGQTEPDIWFSARRLGGPWSTPVNLTNTPNYKEIMLHAAPYLRTNSSTNYTMFIGRSYQAGDPPVPEATATTVWYVGTHTFDVPLVGVQELDGLPQAFNLKQNYPNPFNPSTSIQFSVPVASHVLLKVYDLVGREIATLVNGELGVGNYEATFDASDLASGVYIYKMQAGDYIDVKKMLLAK